MYLNCICTKYSNLRNPDFNYKSYKCRQYGWFWLFFVIYSCFWGTAYWFSLDRNTLSYVDYFVSGYFLVCIVLFIVFGKRLIDRIQHNFDVTQEGVKVSPIAPGVKEIVWLLVVFCIFMTLRMLFESLPDIAKHSDITAFKKDNDSWPLMLGIISVTNILACLMNYLGFYLAHKSQMLVEETENRNRSTLVNDNSNSHDANKMQ